MSGRFGKYGIGLKCGFRFGDNVILKIQTKTKSSKAMITATLNYAFMRSTHSWNFPVENEAINHSLFSESEADSVPETANLCPIGCHGTCIRIENVPQEFWIEYFDINEARQLKSKEKFQKLCSAIAEKYYFYHSGMKLIVDSLSKSGQTLKDWTGESSSIKISIKGVIFSDGHDCLSLEQLDSKQNEVLRWAETMKGEADSDEDSEENDAQPSHVLDFEIYDPDSPGVAGKVQVRK